MIDDDVRMWGAEIREVVATVHAECGRKVGQAAMQRMVCEIAAFSVEVHGRAATATMFYALADGVLDGQPFRAPVRLVAEDDPPEPDERRGWIGRLRSADIDPIWLAALFAAAWLGWVARG